MSKTSTTIYFISGATRGIGLALVSAVASKDASAIIYAGARDPTSPGTSTLKELAEKYTGRIHVVKYIAADEAGNKALAGKISAQYGRVDVAIANAGISNYLGSVHETPIYQLSEHFTVNVLGPVVLFQAFYSLLKASTSPKFIPISSSAGSLTVSPPAPVGSMCYSTSKAALNWVSRKIHFENEWLVCFPFAPGPVETDMLNETLAKDTSGAMENFLAHTPARPVNVAASELVDLITGTTRETEGGQFVNYDRARLPW